MFGKYYGIDWVATILTFINIYLIGNKNKYGFIVGIFANILWAIFSLMAGSVASTFANTTIVFLHIRGYIIWNRNKVMHPIKAYIGKVVNGK